MWGVMVALALGIMLGGAQPVHAQATPTPAQPQAQQNVRSCSSYVGLTNRVVMCMRDTVGKAAAVYFGKDTNNDGKPDSGFFPLVSRAVTAFLTLTVIVYGVMAAYGMLEKPGRDIMLLMVKMSLVAGFVVQANWLYDTSLRIMDNAGSAVVQFAPSTGEIVDGMGADRLECIKNMKSASNIRLEGANGGPSQPNYAAAWVGMDCIIDTVIGIKVAPDANDPQALNGGALSKNLQDLTQNKKSGDQQGMARGLINFFFSSMQSSVFGVILAIVGFVFLYTLVWVIIKALFVYLAGYIGIAFMMIIAPIFIPLVLFRVTSEYFKKWVKLCIAFVMQPVIILAFITFAVSAIDLAVFTGDYSVMYRIAGDASRQQGFNVNKYITEQKIVAPTPTVVAGVRTSPESPELINTGKVGEARRAITGLFGNVSQSKCGQMLQQLDKGSVDGKSADQIRSECSSAPIRWWRSQIDWKAMAAARKSPPVPDTGVEEGDEKSMTAADRQGRTIAREVMAAIMFATIAMLCINGLLTIIPAVINDLVGESFQSPNLFSEVGRQGGSAGGGLRSSIGRMFGGSGRTTA